MNNYRKMSVTNGIHVANSRRVSRRKPESRLVVILRMLYTWVHALHVRAYRGMLGIAAYAIIIFGLAGASLFGYYFFVLALRRFANFISAL